jgi:hypothetical protein
MFDCSFRSRGSRFGAAAFLARSQTKSMPARSFVQDSGARSWARLISAYFVVARRGKNASAHSSSARRARDFRRSQLMRSPRSYAASMSQDEDLPRQVAAYGATAQPAIAARMAPHRRLTQIGTACGVVAVIAATAAVIVFPRFAGAGPGLAWAVGALVSSALMLVICVIQVAVWRRAMASWLGERVQDLQGERQLSWIAHLTSYAVALAALFTCMGGSAAAGWSSASAVLLGITLFFVLAAQVLAGVQFLRPSGPPGTLPAHIRRLSRSRYRND